MEGKGTPKNEQNQFCHSPAVKAITPSEVERQDSHAAGVECSLRDLSPSLMREKGEEGGADDVDVYEDRMYAHCKLHLTVI